MVKDSTHSILQSIARSTQNLPKTNQAGGERTFKTRELQFRDQFARSDELEELEEEESSGKPGEAKEKTFTPIGGPGPNIGEYEQFANTMGRTVDQNANEVPLTDKERKMLALTLSAYDLDTVKNLQKSGVHIRIVDDGNFPEKVQGDYDRLSKQIRLKSSQFGDNAQIPNFMSGMETGRHELGHAVDDMLQPDGAIPYTQSVKDPRLLEMFENYKNRVGQDPSARWDNYDWNRLNPIEYVGEGFEKYQLSEETRQMLKEKDPELYAYIEDMLQKSKDQSLPDKQQMSPIAKLFDGIGLAIKGIAGAIGNVVKGIAEGISGLFKGLFGNA